MIDDWAIPSDMNTTIRFLHAPSVDIAIEKLLNDGFKASKISAKVFRTNATEKKVMEYFKK